MGNELNRNLRLHNPARETIDNQPVSRPSEEQAVALLYSDPQQFVLSWQNTITIIVRKFCKSGMFQPDELDDVCQFINHRLLDSVIGRMQDQYDGSTRIITYFSRIVQNLCYEYRRKNRQPQKVELREDHLTNDPDHSSLLIENEIRRLNNILKMYYKTRPRLELLLKLYARRPAPGRFP